MKQVLNLLIFITATANAQTDSSNVKQKEEKGIHFEQALNWEQIKAKARRENKNIFMDCYATWCGPCKLMDNQVYPSEIVGDFMNEKYISVKVQMDKTSYDNDHIKNWYLDAVTIQTNYSIATFPTFLFFNPDGKPMHKAVGYKDPNQFISLAKDALDSNRQYYSKLHNYQSGKIDTSGLKGLARAYRLSGKELAEKMAADYLTRLPLSILKQPDNLNFMMEFNESLPVQEVAINYLKSLNGKNITSEENLQLISEFKTVPQIEDIALNYLSNLTKEDLQKKENIDLLRIFKGNLNSKEFAERYINTLNSNTIYSKSNIELLGDFTKSSKDPGFPIFYNNRNKIDSVKALKGYAKNIIDKIIQKEEIKPYCNALKDSLQDPDWKQVAKNITKKYNKDYSKRNILYQQTSFYLYRTEKYDTNWPELIESTVNLFDYISNDSDTAVRITDGGINNFCYNAIFLHSTDRQLINKAIGWMEDVLKRDEYKYCNNIDTYANLLYKIGRKNEALKWEEKALKIALDTKDDDSIKLFSSVIAKMKENKPTWIND